MAKCAICEKGAHFGNGRQTTIIENPQKCGNLM